MTGFRHQSRYGTYKLCMLFKKKNEIIKATDAKPSANELA